MIYSMTGYGRAENTIGNNICIVEIRSLNGKQMDIRMNISTYLKPYEIDIRNLISEQLIRGSVECIITVKQNGSSKPVTVNTELLKSYYNSLKEVADDLQLNTDNLLAAMLKLPDVVANNTDQISEEEWNGLKKLILEAIEAVNQHRRNEGVAMEKDLLQRIDNIENLEEVNAQLAPARKEKIKENLLKSIQENVGAENYDTNRFEQELIYYIEKLDICEEQVRLKNHCAYFRELIHDNELSKGKKLSFLLQELGREINTTGSKANDADIQKNVVQMKDELEKAKEQILNIL